MLLRRGAAEVVAVDVGYGELAWSLRTDERVRVHERTNVRTLTPEAIDGRVDLVVAAGNNALFQRLCAVLGEHAATMTTGTDGVLHGMATKVIQTAEGDPAPVHSIASGLDYPALVERLVQLALRRPTGLR